MRAEAVRIAFKFRRKNLQGIYQSPVPRDLHIEECDDIVVREPVFIEFVGLVSDLLQGLCQVEGKVLLLGIEHQGKLVALLNEADQFLVLDVIPGLETGLL